MPQMVSDKRVNLPGRANQKSSQGHRTLGPPPQTRFSWQSEGIFLAFGHSQVSI